MMPGRRSGTAAGSGQSLARRAQNHTAPVSQPLQALPVSRVDGLRRSGYQRRGQLAERRLSGCLCLSRSSSSALGRTWRH